MSYKVKLRQFEGPFDLLVYLIEHAKMSIYDIKVSEITTQYLDYIKEMKAQDVAVAQEFMVLAAELIELKSKMLLPRQEQDEDGDEAEDPRKELVARILEYKQYKNLAAYLEQQEEETAHMHGKPQEDLSAYAADPEEVAYSSTEQFVNAFRAFLLKKQRVSEMRKHYERVERTRMSIENRILQIRDFFRRKKKNTAMFSEMIEEDDSRYGKVLTFVSLLELLKQRTIEAEQKKRFSDIKITLVKEGQHDESEY